MLSMSSLPRDLPAQRLEETWRAVVCAAARTAGRAWAVGCGGHLLYRVVHHVLPLLLRRLRAGRPGRHAASASPHSPSFTTSSATTARSDASREASTTTSPSSSQQQLLEREDEETDGPVSPPRPAAEGNLEASEKVVWALRGLTSRSHAGWLFGWLSDTEQNRESLRLGAFLACMTSSFRVIEFALERLRGRDDGWNAFVAGAVSGSSIAFDSQARQKAVSLYVFFKAFGIAWSLFVVPRLPAAAAATAGGRWSVGQHVMWCVLCGVMMYSFFCEGELLDSFVYRFLYTCTSPHDQYAMSYVRKHALGLANEDPDAKAQERRDFARGALRMVPPPVVVKRREHFASAQAPEASRSRANERAE